MFIACKLTGRYVYKMPKVRQKLATRTVGTSRSSRTSTVGRIRNDSVAEDIVGATIVEYEKHGCPSRGADMARYMKGKFEYYGLYSGERRAIDKKVLSQFPTIDDRNTLMSLLSFLWQRLQRELQYLAIDIAISKVALLCGTSSGECLEAAKFVGAELIAIKSWWDTVDMVASNVIGPMVRKHPDQLVPLMDEWIVSDDMWLRRTALIHQLRYNADTDAVRLFRYCLLCCDEREFFIEKAIGWALRQYFRSGPDDVKRFVEENKHRLAKLSIKEALKHA